MFTSIDPAPPTSELLAGKGKPEDMTEVAVQRLKKRLLDTKLSLFDRYRAMFSLRNIGTDAAIDALAEGFNDESALCSRDCYGYLCARSWSTLPHNLFDERHPTAHRSGRGVEMLGEIQYLT